MFFKMTAVSSFFFPVVQFQFLHIIYQLMNEAE